MTNFAKAIKKMNDAGKKIKGPDRLSKDPERSILEQRLLDLAEKVKKEGING